MDAFAGLENFNVFNLKNHSPFTTYHSLVKRKCAFTLAEVLITLGIIGVVAAMTLPTITQKTQEKQTVAKVKKAYSVLQQAYLMAEQEYGRPDEWALGAKDANMYNSEHHIFLANKFIPYMKVTKNCIGMSTQEVYKNCTTVFNDSASYASVKIVDGITIIFRSWYPECGRSYGNSKQLKRVCGSISIDTNATAKPNLSGNDIFSFYLTQYGIYPVGTESDILSMETYCTRNTDWGVNISGYGNGVACTAWVLYNENMEYLRCDLNWHSGKKTCK